MKKILLLLLICAPLFAQNEVIRRIEFNGAFDSLAAQITTLLGKDFSTSAKQDSIKAKLNDIKSLINSSSTVHLGGYNQTLTNQSVTTISTSSFTKSFSFKAFCNSDSIEVDTNPYFSSPTVAYPYSSTFTLENFNPNTFTTIYIKRLGSGNGTASYNYTLWGY
jgi:hypothetical protein